MGGGIFYVICVLFVVWGEWVVFGVGDFFGVVIELYFLDFGVFMCIVDGLMVVF